MAKTSDFDTPSIDIIPILEKNDIKIKPQGYSMYPLFVPGRDYAVITKANPDTLKRGDVVLYRRIRGILVLHRIYRKNNNGFYMVGDNQTEIEGPLMAEQIKGLLIGIERNGHYFSVKNPIYRFLSSIWLFLRPIRHPLCVAVARVKRLFKK
jgi:hypothetical protein